MRALALLVCLLGLWASPVLAQPGDMQQRVALARHLLAATMTPSSIDQMSAVMEPMMLLPLKQHGLRLTDDADAKIKKIFRDELQRLMADSIGDIAKAYAQTFTLRELQALVAFYSTDVGKKALAVMPALMGKIGPDLRARFEADTPTIRAKIAAALNFPAPAAS